VAIHIHIPVCIYTIYTHKIVTAEGVNNSFAGSFLGRTLYYAMLLNSAIKPETNFPASKTNCHVGFTILCVAAETVITSSQGDK
jgi:hypothetical protein